MNIIICDCPSLIHTSKFTTSESGQGIATEWKFSGKIGGMNYV